MQEDSVLTTMKVNSASKLRIPVGLIQCAAGRASSASAEALCPMSRPLNSQQP